MIQGFLAETKINMVTEAQFKEISNKGVKYVDKEGMEHTAEADAVILATGRVPNRKLIDALWGKVPELYEIGDCRQPDKIATAIHDADHIARVI